MSRFNVTQRCFRAFMHSDRCMGMYLELQWRVQLIVYNSAELSGIEMSLELSKRDVRGGGDDRSRLCRCC